MTTHTKRSAVVRFFAIGGLAIAAAASGTQALAQPMGGPQRGGHGHGGMGMHGANPEQMERMMERRVSHMLDAVQASPEQRTKIMGIAKATSKDLQPMREQRKASRQKGMAMLTGATVDRAGLEQLRQDQMKLADAMGKRKLAGMMDTFDALTPAQRAQMAERMKKGGRGRMGMGER